MAKISPWYSSRPRDRNVYHDNDRCPQGEKIDPKYRKAGRRCRLQCPACAKLNAQDETAKRLAPLEPSGSSL